MKDLYFRWGMILTVLAVIAFLGILRYQREVNTLPIDQVLKFPPAERVRVIGMVQAASLNKEEPGRVRFRLVGDGEPLSVLYIGEEDDNLRELKTLVIVGHFDPGSREFEADELGIVPNYDYIISAYLIGVIPLILFLFSMERNSRKLYQEIKGTSVYKPEEGFDIE